MRIVIIGACGHINYALRDIKTHSELELCGVSAATDEDMNRELFKSLTEETGCCFYMDYHDMLDRLKPDVAVIAARYDQNGPVSIECLKRGINCMTEKAIAHDLKTLNLIRKTADKSEARIIGMHGMRYEPEFYAAYKAVKAGAVGTPMLFTGQKSYKFGNQRPEFYKQRQFYGGTIPWVALHAIDWAHWIMGDFSTISAIHSNQHNFHFGECEASAIMSFGFTSGAMGSVNADFYQPLKSKIHGDDRLRIAGELGIVNVHEGKAYLTTHEQETHELPLEEGEFFADFCSELKGEAKCRLSMEDTLRVTELALRARESADTGKLIKV
jgi:predicted dehydrogenase